MAFRLNVEEPKRSPFPVEEEAKRVTVAAWRRRNADRLFPYVELKWEDQRDFDRWDDAFSGKAVGILPPLEFMVSEFTHRLVAVGVWTRQHRGFLDAGNEIVLQSFSGPGSTLHRGVGLVGFVHVLPPLYQRYALRFESEEGDDGHCGYCGYTFRDDEHPCADCMACASCCHAQGSYPATCWEVQSDPHRAYWDPSVRHEEMKEIRGAA